MSGSQSTSSVFEQIKLTPAQSNSIRLTGCDVAKQFQAGRLKIRHLVQAIFDRMNEPAEVDAWVVSDMERAYRRADDLDRSRGRPRGPLYGVPAGIKDLFHDKDNGAAYGTARVWEVKGPNFDAFAVRVLRDHGLLILGKTVTTEFAWTMIGRNTKNPHKHSHSPGGSSSGSAAAVANYECPIAVGSQTFGSIIRPASYCGVYGFKPTHGAVSTEGMKGFAPSLDSVGFFSRSVADMQALAGMFRLEDEREATFKGLKGAKLAWVKGPAWGKATESAKDALDKAVRLLAKHGAAVEELNLDARYDKTLSDHRIIATKELSRNVDTDYTEEELCPDRMLLDFIDEGNSYTIAEYKNAQNRYEALRPRFDDLSSGYEAILTLSATGEAPKGLAFTGDSSMNSMWTALHTPCISIPGFGGETGLPIGIQLIQGRWRDLQLLAVAKEVGRVFESEGDWKSQL